MLGSMTNWLDDEEMAAWRGLVETFMDLSAVLEAELLDGHALTMGEYSALVQLSETPERRLRMCDFAGRLHLSPSGTTRRIEELVRSGYVRREPDTTDRRVINAVLTDAGMAKLVEAAPTHVEGVRRHLFDHLTRTQVRQLGGVLKVLQDAEADSRA